MNITVTYQNGTGAGSGRVRVGHNSSAQNPDAVWSFTLTQPTTSLTFNLTWDNEAAGTGWRGAYDYAFAISSVGTANKQLAKGSNNIAKVVLKLSGVKGSAEVKFNKSLTGGTYYLRANFNGSTLSTMKAFSQTVTGSAVTADGSGGGAVYARKIYIEKSIKKDENDNTIDRLVMVGYNGMLLRSTDGTTWSSVNTGTSQALYGVSFVGGRFLAVGANGTIVKSSDSGSTWASQSLTSSAFESATFANGLWVVAGGTEIWASTDFTNWVMVLQDASKENHLGGVLWDGEKFIAYGFKGGNYVSNDGYSWDWMELPSRISNFWFIKMIKAEGYIYAIRLVQGGAIERSKDGYSWENVRPVNGTKSLVSIAYGNGRLVAVGELGLITYSDDGKTWTGITWGTQTNWDAIGYGFGKFIVGGTSTANTPYRGYSTDGATWTGFTSMDHSPTDVEFGLSKYHYDIRQACLEELMKRNIIQKVEGEVENTLPPRYGVDYKLGDIVEVNAAGYQGRQRITKVRHVLEPNRVSITPVIGDDFLDLRQFIAREVNK